MLREDKRGRGEADTNIFLGMDNEGERDKDWKSYKPGVKQGEGITQVCDIRLFLIYMSFSIPLISLSSVLFFLFLPPSFLFSLVFCLASLFLSY